jgi:peptidoglycan/xylan/chitin deacetylase (PgdA/CDA1 family)
LKAFLKQLFMAGGGLREARAAHAPSFRILMYHRFVGDAGLVQQRLRAQLRHIRKHYRPVPLSAIAESHGQGAISVTVDDGYLDFATAWPVFREEGVPVTLYVVSGFLNRQLWLWPDLLDYALKSTGLPTLDVPLPDGSRFRGAPNTVFDPIAQALIRSSDQDRRSFLDRLPELTAVSMPAEIPAAYAPLEWAQLKRMAEEGLGVGAHTRTHPILSRLASFEQKQDEIAGSKADIEREIGMPVQHFCYPNGKDVDFDADCVRAAEAAGFATAVTAVRGLNAPGADRWRLRRIGVDPGLDPATFAMEAAGFRMS